MKNASKWISLMLVLVMVLGMFTGCGQKQAETTEPEKQETTAPAPEKETEEVKEPEEAGEKALEDYTEPMTLVSYQAIGTASPADTENNKYVAYIREKFNIDLSDTQFVTSNDASKIRESLGLMIASGEMPDVITMNIDANNLKLAQEFVDSGMLLDVTEYLNAEKMPNMAQDWNDAILENYRSADGKLYMIPSFTINPDNTEAEYTMEPNMTFTKRADLFEELGLEDPKTPEDLYQILLKLKEQPDVDGQAFIPFQTLMGFGDLEMMIGGMFGIWNHRGEINEAEKRFTDRYEFPEYVDFLKYAAKLYREGLTDPEMFINSWEICYARAQEGRIGIYPMWPNELDVLTAGLRQVVADGDYQAFAVPKAEGVESSEFWQTATMGTMITLINKDVKDPERVIKFLDWNVSPEGWIAQCYGGPGVDENDGVWHMEDGKFYYNTEFVEKMNQEDPTYMSQVCGGWAYYMLGRQIYHINHHGFENVTESPDPQRMYARELNNPEVYMNPELERIQAIPAGPVELAKYTAVDKVLQDGVQLIVTTAQDDAQVEAMYAEMIENAKKAGYTEVMEERYERYLLWKDGKLEG